MPNLFTESKPMSERPYIRDFVANQRLEGVFAIQNAQLGTTKNGKPFLKCLIADKTGRTPCRMWSITEEYFAKLPTDGFVFVKGNTQPYQGEMQVIADQVKPHLQPTAAELAELLPATENNIDQMFTEVTTLLHSIKDPAINALAMTYLSDAQLMDRFAQAPAAMTLHHAYLGGLLEHTLGLMKAADVLLPLYPKLSRDVVLMGLFLHDLGKVEELTWLSGFGYSADGQLVGHIGRGAIMLDRKIQETQAAHDDGTPGTPVTQAVQMVLTHIVYSHHEKPEFGALKVPSTPEAIFVSLLDNLDAKMNMSLAATRPNQAAAADLGGHFTEKVWALGTKLYRPDPTTVPDEVAE